MATATLMTGEQFDRLPEQDDRRWELLDGELIEMPSATYAHNRTLSKLSARLEAFLTGSKLGESVPDTEFSFGSERRLRPDLAVLLAERAAQVDRQTLPAKIAPNIVGEIVSPSESAVRLGRKARAYLDGGVQEVWMFYPDLEELLVRRVGSVQLYGAASTFETPLLPGFSLRIADLF